MAKGKLDPNQFTIIERHPDHGPTLDEIHETLHDWFYKVLVTGEYRKQGKRKSSVEMEDVTPEVNVDDPVQRK